MKPSIRITLQLLAFATLAALSIYLSPKYSNPFKYHFEIGQPWAYGLVTAESNFAIYKTEAQLQAERQELLRDYTPCYIVDTNTLQSNIYVLPLSEIERIHLLGCTKVSVLYNRIATQVPVSNLHTPKEAYEITHKNLLPNLQYDSITSEKWRENLLSSISLTQGAVQAGEKIIDTGEIVTEHTYQILESLRRTIEEKNISHRQSLTSTIGTGLYIVILIVIFALYLFTYRRKLLDNLRNILFFAILMFLMIATAFVILQYASVNYIYLIPFAWAPIIARVFYDSRTAIFMHIITILIISVAVPAPYLFVLLQVITGIVAVISLRDMTQRAQLARTALWTFLTYCVLYTAITMLMSGSLKGIEYNYYIYFAINAVLVICAYGLIFLFERTFGLVSSITLVELTNVNSNLMLEFAEKAPGTFQHSLQVSNLATEAAKRIGAKVLLVRTGALYHDIGKMTHPECFIENQSGVNPLQSMSYEEAAKVIIEHVTEGERIARKQHLPEVIVHFIRSHHGTSVTRYFYNSAVNRALSEGKTEADVNKECYTYPGPKPYSKEAAILMMADAIEARSRTLNELTEQSIAIMVDQMIDTQVADGQFSETKLSFKDLEDIRVVFKQKLIEINHHRITYPTIEEK
ncbi:MAG: HDIG domain-containing protein [Paludibacteraceae bacterium]|jgi:putative nucleotidyltransferase with HDIG domain|nr:HDIG domain-containing protein [Paludibacteraceae bacterium]